MTLGKIDIGTKVSLQKIIEGRLLIQGNSGSGKSVVVRNILEESHDRVLFIVLDIEGEYYTLREKYDVMIIGGNAGDVPINVKAAPLLPRKIMEERISTILDLSDMKAQDRVQFIKQFLEALLELPKELRMPCLVVLEESHKFAGQQELQDSTWAVIDLMARGRKRGYTGVLVTQRIAKLHKDAVAECNTKFIGRTFMDIDMKRAADELGFASKQDMLSLRDLKPGQFYAFGNAVDPHHPHKVDISLPKTKHPKLGLGLDVKPMKTTPRIQEMLQKLVDLPKEEEKKRLDREDLIKKIQQLEKENRAFKHGQKPQLVADDKILKHAEFRGWQKATAEYKPIVDAAQKKVTQYNMLVMKLSDVAQQFGKLTNIPMPKIETKISLSVPKAVTKGIPPVTVKAAIIRESAASVALDGETQTYDITPAQQRILKALADFLAIGREQVSRKWIAARAGTTHKSSAYINNLGALRSKNYINYGSGGILYLTEEGKQVAPSVDAPISPDDMWKSCIGIVSPAQARILEAMKESWPEPMGRVELAEKAGTSASSSAYINNLGALRSAGMIDYLPEGKIKLNEWTMMEES